MAFLNNTGLEYLWTQITSKITESLNELSTVARSGNYSDLSGAPTIGYGTVLPSTGVEGQIFILISE